MSVGDRSWLRASDDVVRKRLQQEMARLDGADPFAVLGLPKTANDGDIRVAFLEATKTFHPNRFARRTETIRDLANEVFLVINKAYSQLSDDDGRKKAEDRIRSGRRSHTTQSPIPVSRAGEVLKSPTTPSSRKIPVAARARAKRASEAQAAAPRSKRTTETPAVSTTVAFRKKKSNRSAGADKPAGRKTPTKPMSVDELRRQRRRERMASRRRASTPSPRAPTPPPPEPKDPDELTQQVLEKEEKRKEAFRAATSLLRQGQLANAKEMFRQLAIENPTMTKYRVFMHYVWGRELHAAGRDREALAEYNRALGLDPNFEPALKSVAALRLDDGKKQGGILSKFFGKE